MYEATSLTTRKKKKCIANYYLLCMNLLHKQTYIMAYKTCIIVHHQFSINIEVECIQPYTIQYKIY